MPRRTPRDMDDPLGGGRSLAGRESDQVGDLSEEGEHWPAALTVRELYRRIRSALARVFPGSVWVTGELRSISRSSQGHHYLELADPEGAERGGDATVRVVCWRTQWETTVAPELARTGITLEEGMVVRVLGDIGVYDRASQINLRMQRLDTEALLGKLAAQKARLLRRLEAEGLLERNRSLPLPSVVLRIGLVASVGTEGYRDFVGRLEASEFAFTLLEHDSLVQGAAAPESIASGIRQVMTRSCDLIVLVRGGGARGDLVAFDSEEVALAIAGSSVPVWTGIGHTGDISVADLLAHSSFITPTACGEELVARVRAYWDGACAAATSTVRLCNSKIDLAAASLATSRRSLAASAMLCVGSSEQHVSVSRRALASGARWRLRAAWTDLSAASASAARLAIPVTSRARSDLASLLQRLVVAGDRRLESEAAAVANAGRLLDAYDYHRQLQRGYTLTRDAEGRLLRSISALSAGALIRTEMADGRVTSVVEQVGL